MKKILSWAWDNILFLITLFLLAFIPLYPKLPLLDIKNTWVYVRLEDFLIFFVLALWVFFLIKKKITLKTPLTIPILAFWLIGAISTIHGVLFIFPSQANVFPNVAFLSYVRHIEYISLFFVAYAGMRNKKFLPLVVATLTATLLGVVFYGLGQKYAGFPAYLTMNEEFAKGVPIHLSDLSRLPSTFAGHYDLAAYLVLIIPILTSMFFGFKNKVVKLILATSAVLGFGLLFMTVSRVSFFVLIIALFIVLFFQKKKFVILSVPFIILFALIFLLFKPTLFQRFGNTIKETNVLVNGRTGAAVGNVTYVPVKYFDNKTVKIQRILNDEELGSAIQGQLVDSEASPSSNVPYYKLLPPDTQVPLVVASNISTGENLPQGTGYINLSLSPVAARVGDFFYELSPNVASTTSAQVVNFHGDFLVKRAAAYDLSFTTRFQGEWPHALSAFERNIFIGSGYGSVSLAVDNNFLRILGEIGLFGMLSFVMIFLGLALYMKRVWKNIDSTIVKSFLIGICAGITGLFLNATLIDVFEASKIAYLLWMLVGITVGLLHLYQDRTPDMYKEFKRALTSPYAIAVYLLLITVTIYSPMISNYFVGDDFTWFRWAASCGNPNAVLAHCNFWQTIIGYFTDSQGFFYRPGTKTYFYLMYQLFWLNQIVYHAVSIVFEFFVALMFFLISLRILKSRLWASLVAVLFLVMSGYVENVFWIAATGHVFSAFLALTAILFFALWDKKKNIFFYILSWLSIMLGLLFHEQGMVVPLLIVLYKTTFGEYVQPKKLLRNIYILLLFLPDLIYLVMRYFAHSHWFNGDYSYNIFKLPFNIIGNIIGYVLITVFGQIALSPYESLREILRSHILVSVVLVFVLILVLTLLYRKVWKRMEARDKKIIIFGSMFFVIALLPFLGLGNITSRYSFLASFGIIILFVFVIQKIYQYLLINGRDVALGVTTLVIIVFALFHIIQDQQAHKDWNSAGDTALTFLTSIEDQYSNTWGSGSVQLHFVNVPQKVGDAWVFPVGLSDALWFSFDNPKLQIFQNTSLEEAKNQVRDRGAGQIFNFNGDGSVEKIIVQKKQQ